jgi:hypothetical protein
MNDELDLSHVRVSKNHEVLLTEYHENHQLMQTFEYKDDQLFIQTLIQDDEVSSMQFVYSDDGRLDSAYIRQSWFPRALKFHYEDSLIREWEVWHNNNLKQYVFLERDDQGRIIIISRVSLNLGLLRTYKFTWEGQNYTKYEFFRYSNYGKQTFVYEFKYDQQGNPYHAAFRNIGFNFVDFLPLSENNATEMVAYQIDKREETEITFKNQFLYFGKYPFVRESAWKQGNNSTDVYGVFRYNN